jgi:hypothetical protein
VKNWNKNNQKKKKKRAHPRIRNDLVDEPGLELRHRVDRLPRVGRVGDAEAKGKVKALEQRCLVVVPAVAAKLGGQRPRKKQTNKQIATHRAQSNKWTIDWKNGATTVIIAIIKKKTAEFGDYSKRI